MLALFILSPSTAHAGFFSVVSSMFGGNTEEFSASSKKYGSSQKMQLLEAPLSPNTSIGGGDITIVDQSALESEGNIGTDVHVSADQISLYVVRNGDTLAQIAKMFGVSKNTIIWGNDLKNGSVSVGQTLVILPVSGVQHTVKSGDTIESIAKKYGSDADEIRSFNEIREGDKLAVGDEIIVPDGEIAAPATPVSSGKSKVSPKIAVISSGVNVLKGYFAKIFPSGVGRVSQGLHGLNGVDVAAPLGTPILAAASGVITVAKDSGWNAGYGDYVVISHDNGTQTLYAHMATISVSPGTYVERGQMIGRVGLTGRTTGPHTHFEVRRAKNPYATNSF